MKENDVYIIKTNNYKCKMIKKLIFIAIAILVVSCNSKSTSISEKVKTKTSKVNIKPIAFFSFWDIFLVPDYLYKKWRRYRAKRLIRKAAEAEAEAKRKAYEPKRRELEDFLLRGIGDEDPRNKWDREVLDPLAVDGELQEIYAIEEEVDELLTLLSEDEKKELVLLYQAKGMDAKSAIDLAESVLGDIDLGNDDGE